MPHFNGIAFLNHVPIKKVIELDACLEGLGAIYQNQVYSIRIPKNFENYTIVHLEMLNILVALRVGAMARNISMLLAIRNIELQVIHIGLLPVMSGSGD